MSVLAEDLRYAVRMLRKNPGFAAVAILALALGSGANTTMFSTLKAMVLRPLAFPGLERIFAVSESLPARNRAGIGVAPPDYVDLTEQNSVFEQMAAMRGRGHDSNLTGAGVPLRLEGQEVTPGFFPLLGIRPLLG
ncbi:MAG: ABC transporter permease, partial [Acidobacteria bacterium]|nr:ABC transporter permease [Acidobacteriota bacterium]